MDPQLNKALEYIADAVESGYSALFTYGCREILNREQRAELATIIRQSKHTSVAYPVETVGVDSDSTELN